MLNLSWLRPQVLLANIGEGICKVGRGNYIHVDPVDVMQHLWYENVVRRSAGDNGPCPQCVNAVTETGCHVYVVQNDDDAPAAFVRQTSDKRKRLDLMGDVECCCGFV